MERQASLSPKAHLESHDKPYIAHDVIGEVTGAACVSFLAGCFAGGVRNAMSRQNFGPAGFVTRQAPIIGIITAAPTAYTFVRGVTCNIAEKEDAWAGLAGGFAAGCVLGLPFKRFPAMLALGTAVGLTQGALEMFGGRIDSFKKEDDEFERKEIVRRTTRLPVEQTISEIGEGRGIRPPGYEERRRERIKEKYGFEIDPVKATIDGSE